eukprot:302482-Prymnesium_polylepis.1
MKALRAVVQYVRHQGHMIVDCGGEGNCGTLTAAYLLGKLGMPINHIALRRAVVTHVLNNSTKALGGTLDGLDDITEPTLGHAILVGRRSYGLQRNENVETAVLLWSREMLSAGKPVDGGWLTGLADLFQLRIELLIVSGKGVPDQELALIDPCGDKPPRFVLPIVCVVNHHFAARVQLSDQTGPEGKPSAARPASPAVVALASGGGDVGDEATSPPALTQDTMPQRAIRLSPRSSPGTRNLRGRASPPAALASGASC